MYRFDISGLARRGLGSISALLAPHPYCSDPPQCANFALCSSRVPAERFTSTFLPRQSGHALGSPHCILLCRQAHEAHTRSFSKTRICASISLISLCWAPSASQNATANLPDLFSSSGEGMCPRVCSENTGNSSGCSSPSPSIKSWTRTVKAAFCSLELQTSSRIFASFSFVARLRQFAASSFCMWIRGVDMTRQPSL